METASNNRHSSKTNLVQLHHSLKLSKTKQRNYHAQQRRKEKSNESVSESGRHHQFDSSFQDLGPHYDIHKTLCHKVSAHNQLLDDPDTIEFCIDEDTACAKYCKDLTQSPRNTFDPQVRWSRNNIAVTMERFQPIASPSSASESSSCTSHQDYSYAYYEPGAIMCHSNIPTPEEVAGPSAMPPPNSMRALLMRTKERNQKFSPTNRHTYQTRYGTHENIYEDVSDEKPTRLVSSTQSLIDRGCTKKEFQHILNNHYRVLEELNLSVEEMLMSSSPPNEQAPVVIKRDSTLQSCIVDNLDAKLNSLDLKDDHMKSPVSEFLIGEDSGFSGSSSGASYVGSLRNYKTAITRSLRRSSAPTCAAATNGTVYGSCLTAKRPVNHENKINAGGRFYSSGAASVKLENEIVGTNAAQKSLKFCLWNRRS